MAPIDQVQLHFNPQTLQVLNAVLGLVMFGVALDLRVEDFRVALRTPKALALGLLARIDQPGQRGAMCCFLP